MSNEISKQEFLKRYMESNKDADRKRKKKSKPKLNLISRFKIVDQDIDIKSMQFGDKADEDDYDDAPVVAEVIDERPLEIKVKELYESSRWKKIVDNENSQTMSSVDDKSKEFNSDVSNSTQSKPPSSHSLKSDDLKCSKQVRNDFYSDSSPPRNHKKSLNMARHDSDSDISPPRSQKDTYKIKYNKDSDASPPRHKKQRIFNKRHDSGSDISPPRSRQKGNNKSYDSSSDNSSNEKQAIKKRLDSDSDISPPRIVTKRKHDSDSDISPPRSERKYINKSKHNSDSDQISIGKNSRNYKTLHEKHSDHNDSVLKAKRNQMLHEWKRKNKDSDSDLSPPRPRSSKDASLHKNEKPMKTLSGLKAGLQNSLTLRKETMEQRKRAKKEIDMLDDEISGKNAETIIRDRRTGMKRDLNEEKRKKEEENKKTEEQQQKYSEWGKGIEQTQTKRDKFQEDLYEMSKPLARYQDDEDLDERLKSIIHEDDPMAEFIKKKRKKDTPSLPAYNGPPAPPNRFGILPGYRWDGVDRSNGFEKKYFEKNNRTKATQEEAYLWSVQNM